jgi:hypothetical protein
VNEEWGCEVLGERLEALVAGTLPADEAARLREHAAACRDCAALIEIEEHLASPPLEELEAAVPAEWAAGMWGSVRSEIAVRESRRRREWGGWRAPRWAVPAAAAAMLALLGGAGFLARELAVLRQRERMLVLELEQQRQWLAELDVRTAAAAAARGAGPTTAAGWERLLARREPVSGSEVKALLAGLPADATLLSAVEVHRVLRRIPYVRIAGWDEALREAGAEDGLQAGELLRLVDTLGIDLERGVSVARLRVIARELSGAAGS